LRESYVDKHIKSYEYHIVSTLSSKGSDEETRERESEYVLARFAR